MCEDDLSFSLSLSVGVYGGGDGVIIQCNGSLVFLTVM